MSTSSTGLLGKLVETAVHAEQEKQASAKRPGWSRGKPQDMKKKEGEDMGQSVMLRHSRDTHEKQAGFGALLKGVTGATGKAWSGTKGLARSTVNSGKTALTDAKVLGKDALGKGKEMGGDALQYGKAHPVATTAGAAGVAGTAGAGVLGYKALSSSPGPMDNLAESAGSVSDYIKNIDWSKYGPAAAVAGGVGALGLGAYALSGDDEDERRKYAEEESETEYRHPLRAAKYSILGATAGATLGPVGAAAGGLGAYGLYKTFGDRRDRANERKAKKGLDAVKEQPTKAPEAEKQAENRWTAAIPAGLLSAAGSGGLTYMANKNHPDAGVHALGAAGIGGLAGYLLNVASAPPKTEEFDWSRVPLSMAEKALADQDKDRLKNPHKYEGMDLSPVPQSVAAAKAK